MCGLDGARVGHPPIMAKPIRFDQIEVDPERNLSRERLADYEDLEKRLKILSPLERRYYELLKEMAFLHHVLEVKSLDKFLGT
jgi:hypothetical protein